MNKKEIEGYLEDLECYYSSFKEYGIDDGQAELFLDNPEYWFKDIMKYYFLRDQYISPFVLYYSAQGYIVTQDEDQADVYYCEVKKCLTKILTYLGDEE